MTPLQTLLATAPYSGLSDAAAAAAINALQVSVSAPAPRQAVVMALFTDASPCAMWRIANQCSIADTTVVGLQVACQETQALLTHPDIAVIDFTNAAVQAGIALLISGGILSQDLADAVAALGTGQALWTRANNGGRPLAAADVTAARAAS